MLLHSSTLWLFWLAIRYNLETEWKNTFPYIREMDREELFDKGRNEILDNLVSLSTIPSVTWEKKIKERLWQKLQSYVFEHIFEPAQLKTNLGWVCLFLWLSAVRLSKTRLSAHSPYL